MQLLSTKSAYYIKSVRSILKVCRKTKKISIVNHAELAALDDWFILSDVVGFIGKLVIDEYTFFLVVINADEVGVLNEEPVYRIKKAIAVPVLDDGVERPTYFDSLSSGGFDKIKNQHKKLLNLITNKGVSSMKLAEDVVRLINDLETFYFCKQLDLTLSMQRRALNPNKSIDEYFWNRNLLNDLFNDDGTPRENTNEWIVRIIHGYFDQRNLSYEDTSQLRLTLISRRSVKRAGVRYLRRGIDVDANVANFVETEFSISFFDHSLSFVQIRGSIPIYWTQSGFKYRPHPVINKALNESLPAFKEHFKRVEQVYGSPIVVINLVDTTGREAPLGDAFKEHILKLEMENVLYFPFDFHATSKEDGNQTSILLDSMGPDLQKIGFCWIDKTGQIVRQQKGVIRTNCVDCLDRTNHVQSAISRSIVSVQALKLGLIEPFAATPDILIQQIESMWSEHGDCLSRQYSGTDALKKHEKTTRNRQKLIGLVRNGVNSAKRYTNAHIKDYRRQLAIDVLISGKGSTTMKTEGQDTEIASEAQSNSESTESSDGEESNNDEVAGVSNQVN